MPAPLLPSTRERIARQLAQGTISARQPSWREEATDWLRDRLGGDPATARDRAEILLAGGEALPGPGALAGATLDAQEGMRRLGQGDYWAAGGNLGMAVLGALPGGRLLKKVVKPARRAKIAKRLADAPVAIVGRM